MGSSDAFIQALTVLGGLSGIAAVVNAVFSRRKTGADAAMVLTQAASGLVADMERRIEAMNGEIDELKTWKRAREASNIEHRKWDTLVVRHLADAGIDVPEPPSLTVD